MYLQNVYASSLPAQQAVAVTIALCGEILGDRGAYRVHGGGFAGTIQCYIPNRMFYDYKQMIESVFGDGACVRLFVRLVGGYELRGE